MTDQADIDWSTCDEDGCIGVRLTATPKCLAHASDEQRNAMLKQVSENGEIDARGVPMTAELLQRVLHAVPTDPQGHQKLKNVDFSRTTFQGKVSFDLMIFNGETRFDGATFKGNAGFSGATFKGKPGSTVSVSAWLVFG